MYKETYPRRIEELDDAFEAPEDFGTEMNGPKRSPMRRKEKFRPKDFRTDKERNDRKRNHRRKIKLISGFWEE